MGCSSDQEENHGETWSKKMWGRAGGDRKERERERERKAKTGFNKGVGTSSHLKSSSLEALRTLIARKKKKYDHESR